MLDQGKLPWSLHETYAHNMLQYNDRIAEDQLLNNINTRLEPDTITQVQNNIQ